MTARKAALFTLSAVEQNNAWANGELKKEIAKSGLDRRDAALATRLCFGTLQHRILLDYYLQAFSSMKLSKMEPKVRNALRLALYQILFMERIPSSAAVNETVSLTRKYAKNPRAAGMVNGILRSILRSEKDLPAVEQKNPMDTLALRYSHPRWLLDELSLRLSPEELEELLCIHNSAAPTTLQINLCRTSLKTVQERLQEEGVMAEPHPWLPNCLVLESVGNLEQLSVFRDGEVYVQDPAAKLAVLAAEPKPKERVLDACAAPGGKSFAAAIEMNNQGTIVSCDLYEHKQHLIEAGAQRLGLSCIQVELRDASSREVEWEQAFDLVIADVPCSGLGVIRKKPEIRYKNPEEMKALPAIQQQILTNLSNYVRPGGRLLYATCTLRQEENEEMVRHFLTQHPEFSLEGFTLPGPLGKVDEGMVTLWPQRLSTDGFFVAKLRRQA